jgi:hypothetical protein
MRIYREALTNNSVDRYYSACRRGKTVTECVAKSFQYYGTVSQQVSVYCT